MGSSHALSQHAPETQHHFLLLQSGDCCFSLPSFMLHIWNWSYNHLLWKHGMQASARLSNFWFFSCLPLGSSFRPLPLSAWSQPSPSLMGHLVPLFLDFPPCDIIHNLGIGCSYFLFCFTGAVYAPVYATLLTRKWCVTIWLKSDSLLFPALKNYRTKKVQKAWMFK